MPALPFSQDLAANQRGFNPLSNWQFEYVPVAYARGAAVSVLARSDGAASEVEMSITTGSQTIQERAPVQVGGTEGVTPSPLNTTPVTFVAMPGDRIKLSIDETGGVATTTIDGLVEIEPL